MAIDIKLGRGQAGTDFNLSPNPLAGGDRFEICPRLSPQMRAFTLIELLAVIAILGLIAAFAVPQVLKWVSGARSDSARIQIEALGASIDLYRLEVGSFPPTLEALVEKPPGADRWDGPYLKKKVIPKDPWGHSYVYRYPGKNGSYDLMSLGADNSEGGEGEQKDIVSWE